MANKGTKNHFKRSSIPDKVWIRNKKEYKYIRRQAPGPHTIYTSLSLGVLLRDIMKVVDTLNEASFLLNKKAIKIDGKARKGTDFPIGFMDCIEMKGGSYRLVLDSKGRYTAEKTENKDSKPLKITNKVVLAKGKYQITFHDGRTKETKDNNLRVGDVVNYDTSKNEIKDILKPEEGATCIIMEGRHAGQKGTIKKLAEKSAKKDITVDVGGKDIITRYNYIFPVKEEWL
jgi:small subunit ribosomal protein S4e